MASTMAANSSSDPAGNLAVLQLIIKLSGEKAVVLSRGDITDFAGKAIVNDGALIDD
jgi:hypothetical protein